MQTFRGNSFIKRSPLLLISINVQRGGNLARQRRLHTKQHGSIEWMKRNKGRTNIFIIRDFSFPFFGLEIEKSNFRAVVLRRVELHCFNIIVNMLHEARLPLPMLATC